MRKYYRHYSYRPESFGEFCAMAAWGTGIAVAVATPIVAGSYFAKKKALAERMTDQLGYEIKSIDSVDLSIEQLDVDKKYYVTLDGKLAEAKDGQKSWSEKYEIKEKDFNNLQRKTANDEKSVLNLYIETCDYLLENVFPYVDQNPTYDSVNYKVDMPHYNSNWVM